jgi:DNA-binding beta-propeller fold protein YncE
MEDLGTYGSCLHFSEDGMNLYIQDDTLKQYTLSTPWNIDTAELKNDITSEKIKGFFLNNNGTKLFKIDWENDKILEYNLPTAWDLASMEFVQDLSVGSQNSEPRDLDFNSEGTKMYMVGSANNNVSVYTLSTPWDISTAKFESRKVRIGNNASSSGFLRQTKEDEKDFYITKTINSNKLTQWKIPWCVGIAYSKTDTNTNLPIYIRIK